MPFDPIRELKLNIAHGGTTVFDLVPAILRRVLEKRVPTESRSSLWISGVRTRTRAEFLWQDALACRYTRANPGDSRALNLFYP